jgi:hypothetical protein
MDLVRLKAELGDTEWTMMRREEVDWLIERVEQLEAELISQTMVKNAELEIREIAVSELLSRTKRLEKAVHSILNISKGHPKTSEARQMWQIAKDVIISLSRA